MGLFTNVAARPCPDPECSEGEGSASQGVGGVGS